MENKHVPVMMNSVMELLDVRPGGSYADLTAGDGGHTAAIADLLEGGRLIACDRDGSALARARANLEAYGDRVTFIHANFKELSEILDKASIKTLDGILVDLGISRYQLTTSERGFSIMNDGPLDMRMDRGEPESAADLVNRMTAQEIAEILRDFGEERYAKKIARAIAERRRSRPFSRTSELAELVSEVKPRPPHGRQKIHPATQTFQALRIAVNHELEGLGDFCTEAIDRLSPHGRLLVITFHSLEDRIIKKRFQLEAGRCICFQPADLCSCHRIRKVEILTRKPVTPDEEEMKRNPASRSAKLRAVVKIGSSGKEGEKK